jgi:hypothetical protein
MTFLIYGNICEMLVYATIDLGIKEHGTGSKATNGP